MAAAAKKQERKAGGYLKRLDEHNKDRRARLQDAFDGDYQGDCGDPTLHWTVGGYIRGRLNLLWGPTKSGKSTLALKWAAAEQVRRGPKAYVIIFDSEYNYEEDNPKTTERFIKCGLDPDYVIISHGNDMNTLFFGTADLKADIASESKKAGDGIKVAAIIVDSWGGISVESAMDKINKGEVADAGNSFGGNAKFINPMIQFFLGLAGDYAVTCFFVQHCIMNMEQYGKRYLLIGGQKLRFLVHCSIFLETIEAQDARLGIGHQAIAKSDVEDAVAIGKRIRTYCDKSRQLVEGRKGEFWFDFENCTFAKPYESLFELASRLGIIDHPIEPETDKKGNVVKGEDGKPKMKTKNAYWCYPANSMDPRSVQWHGKPGVLAALQSDTALFKEVFKECMDTSKKNATEDSTDYKALLEGESEGETE